MTTILFLVFIAYVIHCYLWLRRVARHDRVLFPFCQLRRDIIKFLYVNVIENQDALSSAEYRSARRLLDVVSDTIHDYNDHKAVMFNLRDFLKYVREYRHIIKQTVPDLTSHPEIQNFHHRFAGLLARAFIAYTPFIRSEAVLRLFAAFCRIGKMRVQYAITVVSGAHEDRRRYGESENDMLAPAN